MLAHLSKLKHYSPNRKALYFVQDLVFLIHVCTGSCAWVERGWSVVLLTTITTMVLTFALFNSCIFVN